MRRASDLSTMEIAGTGWIASMRTTWRHTMRDSHWFRLLDQTIIETRSPLRVISGPGCGTSKCPLIPESGRRAPGLLKPAVAATLSWPSLCCGAAAHFGRYRLHHLGAADPTAPNLCGPPDTSTFTGPPRR